MNWLHRYQLRDFLRTNFWAAPACAIVFALLVGRMLRAFDDVYDWDGFGFTREGATAVLGAFVGSMLTFIVVLVSSLLLVLQLVSAQLTPRIIATTIRHPLIRVTLTLFIFCYMLSVAALGRIEDVVPQMTVAVVIVANVLSLILLLYFVGAMVLSLRPARVLATAAENGRRVILDVYPAPYDPAADAEGGRDALIADLGEPSLVVEHIGASGVLVAFDTTGLIALARRHQCVIELVPRVGDFVASREPLFRIYGQSSLRPRQLCKLAILDAERTMEQDPGFPFRVLADIAAKALSPSINDPTTAVLAIDQMHRVLRCVGTRKLYSGRLRDSGGALRLVVHTPTWEEFVWMATAEIRHYGRDSIKVCTRLRTMLVHLINVLPEARRPALMEQIRLLDASVERSFPEPADRRYVRAGDATDYVSTPIIAPNMVTRTSQADPPP